MNTLVNSIVSFLLRGLTAILEYESVILVCQKSQTGYSDLLALGALLHKPPSCTALRCTSSSRLSAAAGQSDEAALGVLAALLRMLVYNMETTECPVRGTLHGTYPISNFTVSGTGLSPTINHRITTQRPKFLCEAVTKTTQLAPARLLGPKQFWNCFTDTSKEFHTEAALKGGGG